MFRSDHYLSVLGQAGRGSLDAWATLAGLAAQARDKADAAGVMLEARVVQPVRAR